MKMFRRTLAGILPAFLLLVCVQLNVRAACTPPPPEMQSWFTGDDTVKNHIWQSIGPLYSGATYATATVAAPSQTRQLFFEDRVAYQRAIEEVYWRHRIWPKEIPDSKPSLDEVIPPAQLEKKVKDYLRNSQALEDYWRQPITAEQLQAEMQRMAKCTKQPNALREIFEALGNDPFVIAECLVRPVLSERLVTHLYTHGQESLDSWRTGAQNGTPKAMTMASGYYRLPTISDRPDECINDGWTATSSTNAPTGRYLHTAVWTGSEMIIWGGYAGGPIFEHRRHIQPGIDNWTATSTTNAPIAVGARGRLDWQ